MYNQNNKNKNNKKKDTYRALNKLVCFHLCDTIGCGPLQLFSLRVN